jgi:UDP-4-keto-D-QuiNAc 4-reductase
VTVLVCGATGFVGRHLCGELIRRGYSVRGTIRREADSLPVGVERALVEDLADRRALDQACRGATAVIHLAARVHVMGDRSTGAQSLYQAVNVEGSRVVCEAARSAGVRRFVYMSSAKVNGDGGPNRYREVDTPAPQDAYGLSKWEAEQTVASVLRGAVAWTILRPPLVYGPNVRGNFRRLLQLAGVASRVPLPLDGIENCRSLVYVGNLVDAIIRAIGEPTPAAETYLLSDGEDVSTTELIRRLSNALGSPARMFGCPVRLLTRLLKAAGREEDARRLFGSMTVDSSAIRQQLEWHPPYSLNDGLAQTAAWWNGAPSAAGNP